MRRWTDVPRLIHGADAIAGYGTRWFYVAAIPSKLARDTIVAHHYSGTYVRNSYVHVGVFVDGTFAGVLQLGYALNPARMGRIVRGTGSRDYLELNRMWLDDRAPRNSESRAIGYTVRYIRAVLPRIKFIQSFADERCGGLGVVYQACNFLYVGEHKAVFYRLDGEWYHSMMITAHRKSGVRGAHLVAELGRAERFEFRQFRYIRFLHRRAQRHLLLPVLPYPKPETSRSVIGDASGDHPGQLGSIPGDRSTFAPELLI